MQRFRQFVVPLFAAALLAAAAPAQEHRIVVGPRNVELQDGADALLAGDAERGVRLTEVGLEHAASRRERLMGMSNLCAGYILLERYDDGLELCSRVIDEDPGFWRALANRALIHVLAGRYDEADADLRKAEAIAPDSHTVRGVRDLLADRAHPVQPVIQIEDRRQPPDEGRDD